MIQRLAAWLGLAMIFLGAAGAAPAAAAGEGQYLVHDAGTAANIRNLLPAGQGRSITATDFLQNKADPTWYPPHVRDQQPLYDGPTFTAAGQLTSAQFQQFTKEATFGVPDDQVESIENPKPGLTIIRDKAFGVPHIFATSRALAQYGSGWVSAEDRLFMMDVLRHAGRGNLASLIGSDGYQSDCDTHYGSGYDAADEAFQKAHLDPGVVAGGEAFAQGVNDWIASPGFVQHMPAEYVAFPPPVGLPLPLPVGGNAWKVEDTLAVGALIGSQLGGGGGSELANTLAYEKMASIYGATTARQIFNDLHASNDPESPTTIAQSFPYEQRTGAIDPSSVAMVDPATPVTDPQGCVATKVPPAFGQAPAASSSTAKRAVDIVNAVRFKKHASNAQVVGAALSASGHPIVDFGSQAAYFSPEIWMEMDVHAPDWDARGFQFPGTGVFVEIGRGQDFAWSATSAMSDNIDTRAERLCNPNSQDPLANVAADSTNYWYKGRCLAMEEKSLQYIVPPSPGSQPSMTSTPWTGTETFKVERAAHDDGIAIIQGRTMANIPGVGKVPIAISRQRTNFMHELEQAIGFQKWNSNAAVHDAQSFIDAAAAVDTTFNWFYADSKDIAYYSSGKLPIRNPAADPDLLNWATGEWDWQGILPASMHPHAINPAKGYMISWNNRPAPGWGSADSNWDYGSIYRSQLLERELTKRIAAKGKVTSTDLFNVMQVASVTDFRSQRLLDEMFSIIGTLSPSEAATYGAALAAMRDWHSAGDLRQDLTNSGTYANALGISYFDAWYPHVIHQVFNPWFDTTTDDVYCSGSPPASPGNIPKTFDNPPSDGRCYHGFSGFNVGSAYDGGWQDALDKDFRQLLDAPVLGAHTQLYCGGGHSGATAIQGTVAACRRVLLAALTTGMAQRQTDLALLTATDKIQYRALGLFQLPDEQWANKPTQQQFMEFTADRSSAPSGLTVTAAGGGTILPPTSAGAPLLLQLVGLGLLLVAGAVASRRRVRRL